MKKSMIMFAVATLIGFTACEKENEINAPNEPTSKSSYTSILSFNDMEDFSNTLNELSLMNSKERRVWENTHNFRSFATITEDFLYSIDPAIFKTAEEELQFIKENSQFIELYKEDGEFYVEVQEFDNIERFIMNEKKMYIIGKDVYKKFEDVLVKSAIENETELANMKEFNTTFTKSSDKFTIVKIDNENKGNSLKSTKKEVWKIDKEINKKMYRVKIKAEGKVYGGKSFLSLFVVNKYRKLLVWWGERGKVDFTIQYTYTCGSNVVTDNSIYKVDVSADGYTKWYGERPKAGEETYINSLTITGRTERGIDVNINYR